MVRGHAGGTDPLVYPAHKPQPQLLCPSLAEQREPPTSSVAHQWTII